MALSPMMQQYLSVLADTYPEIPKIPVTGNFGTQTQQAVRAFQRIFSLTPDGIIGRASWYAIQRIYTAVKRLNSLSSEGLRYSEAPLSLIVKLCLQLSNFYSLRNLR